MSNKTIHINGLLIVALLFAYARASAQIIVPDNGFRQCINNASSNLLSGSTLDTIASANFKGTLQCSGMGINHINEIIYFSNAAEIYLSNNELRSIPSFKTFQNIDTIDISNNRLSFTDLENFQNIPNYRSKVNPFPQKKLSEKQTIHGYANGLLKLPFLEDKDAIGVEYNWFKDSINTIITGNVLFIQNMNILDPIQKYHVRFSQPQIWGENNFLYSDTTTILVDSFPNIKKIDYSKQTVYCDKSEFTFNSIEFTNPEVKEELTYYLTEKKEFNQLSNGITIQENSKITLESGHYHLAINNGYCSYFADTNIIVKNPTAVDSIIILIDSSSITCQTTTILAKALINTDSAHYYFEATDNANMETYKIQSNTVATLPNSNYTIKTISDSSCITTQTKTFALNRPAKCDYTNSKCYDIDKLNVPDSLIIKDYKNDYSVLIIEGKSNIDITFSLEYSNTVIQVSSIPGFIINNDLFISGEYTVRASCMLNENNTYEKTFTTHIKKQQCPELVHYNIIEEKNCEGVFLACENIEFNGDTLNNYIIEAKANNTRAVYELSPTLTAVEKDFYTVDILFHNGCKLPLTPEKAIDLSKLNCSKVLYLENEESTIFLEGSGNAELINEIGEQIMNVVLPIEWNGQDQNGTILPTGLYGIRHKNGTIEPITIIR